MRSQPRPPIFACVVFLSLAACAVSLQAQVMQPDTAQGEPLSDSRIQVTQIRFDDTGTSALPLRTNFTTPIQKPEWIQGWRNCACLYVQNQPVTFKARFVAPQHLKSAFIFAESTSPVGRVKGQTVHFHQGVSDPEFYTFTTEHPAPPGLNCLKFYWQWKSQVGKRLSEGADMNVSGEHTMYIVLDTPGLPWRTDVVSDQNPWTETLDLAMEQIEGTTVEEMLDSVTRFCFDWPAFKYDVKVGAPCYISTSGGWTFNLTLFMEDINTMALPRVGCCYDGAAIVHTFGGLLGAHTVYVLSGWPYTSSSFGYLNCIDPIGRGSEYCNNPFYTNSSYRSDVMVYQDGTSSTSKRSAFGNHAFAATQAGANGVIWDATMCADVDANQDTSVVFPPHGNYVSSFLSNTVLTDTTQSWVPGEWVGMLLNPNTKSTTPNPYKEYRIVANTATTITVVAFSDMLSFAQVGDHYWIRDDQNPEADIIYLTGYAWPDYESLAVDATVNDKARTDPPVAKTLNIK